MIERSHLKRFAWLSIATAVLTIGLKAAAYLATGSVGLLSDALESGVNLVTAVVSLIVLTVAAQPPDEDHAHGHGKAEYFSSGLEGGLIFIAALTIGYTALRSLIDPQPLQQLGVGLLISIVAAVFNLITALVLRRAGQQHESITLVANAEHLLSDVWTSVGVAIGVGAVVLTGWQWLDPVIALAVAVHILRAGFVLLKESVDGLMDRSLPEDEQQRVIDVLNSYVDEDVTYHALRTRQAGAQRFVSVHIQVPGAWSVQQGHELLEEIEQDLRETMSPLHVITHIEPVEDPTSWEDIKLNRTETADPQLLQN